MLRNRAPILLILLFFLSALPVLSFNSRYMGDERYYTTAAIRMVQTGDWITPYYHDGQLRFNKPILTYWLIAVPYKLFGISFVASRIGPLLAGCAILALTYRLAMILLHDRTIALLAVAACLANHHIISMSMRSNPDALQCALAMLALTGLASLIFERRFTFTNFAAFYVGVGLVVATKGALAIVILGYAVAFVLWRRRRGGFDFPPRRLLHWPTMLLGLLVAAGWFIAIYLQHGMKSWDMFLHDQLGRRVSGNPLYIVSNFFVYIAAPWAEFFPLSIAPAVALIAYRRHLREFFTAHREPLLFGIGWCIVILLAFVGANIQRTRYLLPAYPMLAIMSAGLVVWICRHEAIGKRIVGAWRIVLLLALAIGVALAGLGWRIHPLVSYGGVSMSLLALIATSLLFRWNGSSEGSFIRAALVVSIFFLLLSRSDTMLTRRPLLYRPTDALTQKIREESDPPYKVASFDIEGGTAGQVKVLSKGNIHIDRFQAEDGFKIDDLLPYDLILYNADDFKSPALPPDYRLISVGRYVPGWTPTDMARVMFGLAPADKIWDKRSSPYILASRDRALRRTPTTYPSVIPKEQPGDAGD